MIPQRIEDAFDAVEFELDDPAVGHLLRIKIYVIELDAKLDRFLEAAKQAEEVAG